jgi:GNAT superfamily N-acetyltransferase
MCPSRNARTQMRTREASTTGGGTQRVRVSEIRIRSGRPSDLGLLVRHRQAMWRDIAIHRPAEIRAAEDPYRRWVRKETAARRFHSFIAETRDGTIAGSGAIWLQPTQPRPGALGGSYSAYILSMYTEPTARHKGVATQLVRTMLEWARKRGYPRVTLHASRFGRPLYLKLGFEESNEMRFNFVRRGRVRPSSNSQRRSSPVSSAGVGPEASLPGHRS